MKTKSLTATLWELVNMFVVSETKSVTLSPNCFSSMVQKNWRKGREMLSCSLVLTWHCEDLGICAVGRSVMKTYLHSAQLLLPGCSRSTSQP